MTTYFPGQRVKLVNPRLPENMDIEGFCFGYEHASKGTQVENGILDCDCDCLVQWDKDMGPPPAHQRTRDIVPILPSGAGPCEAEFTIPLTAEQAKELVI
jgi:hypothetical protein